jgi:SMC interacting uncharacterized protein involved in chromosome segregation
MLFAVILTIDVYRLSLQQETIIPWEPLKQIIPRQTVVAFAIGLEFIAIAMSLSELLKLFVKPPDVEKLEKDLENLKRENSKLIKQVSELERSNKDFQANTWELQRKIEELREELEEHQRVINNLNFDLDSKRQELIVCQKSNQELQREINILNSELRKYRNERDSLQEKLDSYMQTVQHLTQELNTCIKKVTADSGEIVDLKNRIEQEALNLELDCTFILLMIKEAGRYYIEKFPLASKILLEAASRILHSDEFTRRARVLWENGMRTEKNLLSEV